MQQKHLEDFSSQSLAELFNRTISLSNTVEDSKIHLLQSDYVDLQPQTQELERQLVETQQHGQQSARAQARERLHEDAQEVVQQVAPTVNYSISQHYTHSAHIVNAVNAQKVANLPPNDSSGRVLSTYQTLVQNNIPPASLLHSQLSLFELADSDQRSRLIQLWRISPPRYNIHEGREQADGIGEFQTMTLEQEEARAWRRHEQIPSATEQQHYDELMDRSLVPMCVSKEESLPSAELYMTSGYEQLAQRDNQRQQQNLGLANVSASVGLIFGTRYKAATDPIHQSQGWHPDGFGLQSTEHGIFEQINQLQAQTPSIVHIHKPEDEEML